jgi:hypothetical protein
MKTLESTPYVSEPSYSDATVRASPSPRNTEGLRFPSEGILSETNHEAACQTNVIRVNGNSNLLRVELGKFLLSAPPLQEVREFFQAMQKWEGHVIWVGEDSFGARLVPIVGEGPDQEAEILTEEMAADDSNLIEPGAVFYWSIGYLDRPSGRLRVSLLRFRRLPVWTKDELEQADRKAKKLRDLCKNAD